MDKIKPCYCGCKPDLLEGWSLDKTFKLGYVVQCPKCDTQTELKGTKKSAINKWNQERVYIPQLRTKLLKKKNRLRQLLEMTQNYLITINKELKHTKSEF